MRDRTAVLLGLTAGAVVGGVAGWLYLTEGGRRLREQLEPQIGEIAERAGALRASAQRAQRAAADSWRSVQEVAVRPPAR
jgi:gas vesicle protein